MNEILTDYIAAYGYLAIFCLVLLQELGMPGLPNELMLLYFGYLGRRAGLSYPCLISLVILADIGAAFILYTVFYHGKYFLQRIKPRWLRLPEKKIATLKSRVVSSNGRNIFIAKLTPFVRSYLPVVAGLLQVEFFLYGRIVIGTAVIWSGGWVTAGWLLVS
jgi:membrane protein DedA with SNARE-associated domain